MMIGLNAFILNQAWEGRQHVLQHSDEAQTLQHRVLLANVEQTLRQYDYIASELAQRELPKDVNAELRRLKALDPLLMDILIMSSSGVTQYWSGTGIPPNAADRDFFTALRNDPQRTLYVSPSRLSRAHVGKWYFSLSRPIRDAAGNFQGAVVAIIDLAVFNRDLANSLAMDDASMGVFLADGQVVTRLPEPIGNNLTKIELPDAVKQADDGRLVSLEKVSAFDHIVRLFKWKAIPKYGIWVVTSISKGRILDVWWASFQGTVLLWGLLNILMISGAIAIFRSAKHNFAQMLNFQASQASLSESEERLRLAMSSANQGWFDVNLRTGKVDVSEEYVRMIGYEPDTFKTDLPNWLENVHPEDRDAVTANFQACVEKGGPVSMEYRRQAKSGDWKWIQSVGKIVQSDAGQKPVRMIGIHADITKRKVAELELTKAEEQFRMLFNSISDAVYIASLSDRFIQVNQSACELLGYRQEELLQMGPSSLDTAEHAAMLPDRIQALMMSGQLVFQSEHVHKNGSVIPVELSARIIEFEGEPAILAVSRDISERKRAEMELKRSNAELEQFSYAISHDMRQPLRMISAHLGLLKKSLADHLDTDQRESFNFAVEGAKRLDQMLVSLLEYSRVGRKGEPAALVESRALLDEALLFLGPAIEEAGANIRILGEWPRIFVSPDEMLRLMQNLISNAIKFRVTGRTPEITLTSETKGQVWFMRVADNGVGIIPDQIDRLFQVFQRLQSRAAYEGTGIGLALCRKIAEHHHGRIWAESPGEGQGSTFRVELPLK